jgi:hypothetical protein
MLIVFQNSAFHNALLADMPKCTQVCPHGAGEEDLAAEVPADPDPVPTASAADPMGKRGTGHWPLNIFRSMSRFGLVCDHIALTGV